MRELYEDLFSLTKEFDAICITTNAIVRGDGQAVMGGGCARTCAELWPSTPRILGSFLFDSGRNIPFQLGVVNADGLFVPHVVAEEENNPAHVCRIFSFPTKNDFKDNSILELVKESCHHMVAFANELNMKNIGIARPGCGLGGLNYEKEVRPAISKILDDRFVILSPKGN